MKSDTWEMSTLDWESMGDDGTILSPADVAALIFAENREQARNAFFMVAGAVGQNGCIYPCALTVVMTVLAALPNCTKAARNDCLALIGQIASAESLPDYPHILKDCLIEIRNSTWYFIWGLQFDDTDMVSLYVDILGCLGLRFEDMKPTVEKYLKLVLTRNIPEYDVEMIKNTIIELSV